MAERMDNTLIEVLQKLSKIVTEARFSLSDDDQPALQSLLDTFLAMSKQKAAQTVQNVQQAGQQAMMSPAAAQQMQSPQQPYGGGGATSIGGAPNIDELRRMLSQ